MSTTLRGDDLPELLPARMLNEFVYCPRLFYLEWVDDRWASNSDTVKGQFRHRRVDKPGAPLPAADEPSERYVVDRMVVPVDHGGLHCGKTKKTPPVERSCRSFP